MAREIWVGESEALVMHGDSRDDWISYAITDYIIINPIVSANYNGDITHIEVGIDANTSGNIKFGSWIKNSETSWTLRNITAGQTIISGEYDKEIVEFDFTSSPLSFNAGDYIGMCVYQVSTSNPLTFLGHDVSGLTNHYYDAHSCSSSTGFDNTSDNKRIFLYGSGLETGSGFPPDACQSSGALVDEATHSGYGTIKVKDFDMTGSPLQVQIERTAPWESSPTNDTFDEYEKVIFDKPATDPVEHWSIECTDIFDGATDTATFTECHWRESNIYYVKKGGDNDKMGTTWANAFATITKGADTVDESGRLYIGYGEYTGETDITPDNIGTDPIGYYLSNNSDTTEWLEHTLTTNENTYVDSRYSTTNYGSDPDVKLIGNSTCSTCTYGYFGFDISNVRKEYVSKVNLKVKVNAEDNRNVYTYRVNSSWVEGSVTWDTKPTYDSSTSLTTMMDATNWYTLNVTAMFNNETSNSKISFQHHINTSGFNGYVWFNATDAELDIYYDDAVIITL